MTEDVFLLALSGRCLLRVPGTGIDVSLSSCKVSWVFVLVYYMLAACMLIWYLRSLPESASAPLRENLRYSLGGYHGSVYCISQLNAPPNRACKPTVTSVRLAWRRCLLSARLVARGLRGFWFRGIICGVQQMV